MSEKINVRNEFNITGKTINVSVHNEMYNYFEQTNAPEPYGSYLVLSCAQEGEDPLSNILAVIKTTLTDNNFNGESSEHYAVYSAVVEGTAVGGVIRQIGLSPYADGHVLVNRASVGEVKVPDGEEIMISARINLTISSATVAFCTGYNPLIAILLGAEVFTARKIEFALGTNDHIPVSITRDSNQLISEKGNGDISITANAIELSYNSATKSKEGIVYIDGKAVLRGLYGITTSSVSFGRSLGSDNSCIINDGAVKGFTQVRQMFTSVAYKKFKLYGSITSDCTKFVDFAISPASRIVGEPTGIFFAIADKKQVRVYRYLDRVIKHLYSAECSEHSHLALSVDGSLFVLDEKLIGYVFDGENAQKNEVDIATGDPSSLVVIGTQSYCIVCFTNKTEFVRVYLSYGQIEAVDRANFSNDVMVINYDENTAVVFGEDTLNPSVYSISVDTAYLTNKLSTFCQSGNYEFKRMNYGWVVADDGNARYLVNLDDANLTKYVFDDNARYLFLNRSTFLVFKNGILHSAMVSNVANHAQLASIFACEIPEPKDAIIVDDYLLLLCENKIETLYLTCAGWRITVPSLASGNSVSISAVKVKDPGYTTTNTYKISIGLG